MKRALLLSTIIPFFILQAISIYASTIYVKSDASGTGDGSSWANAFVNLQPAIDVAVSGDQVWVAKGTYKPTSWPNGGLGDERAKHFSLKTGVAVYGGFVGTETLLSQRDYKVNETICSGDIGTVEDISDNCYHVFYHPSGTSLGNTAILDGFSVKFGNLTDWSGYGGGIYNSTSSPTISNCMISNNTARKGAGIYNESQSFPTIISCMISGNTGSGIYNSTSSPTISDCTISDNTGSFGVGIWNSSSSPAISDCTISGNTGGGIANSETSSPTINNCTISDNTNSFGGGIYNGISSSPVISDCTISGNTASVFCGGIYNDNSSPTINNCTISDNNGGNTGGGIYNMGSSSPIITSCTISGNTAGSGGGIANDSGSPSISNCTISNNTASSGSGGGISMGGGGSPTISDCMISGNTASNNGGGIANSGSTSISNCTISNNTASSGGGISTGYYSPTISDCTISGNTASNNGGGIYYYEIDSYSIAIKVSNTTIYNNSANVVGGGIYNKATDSGGYLLNCTISSNTADYAGGIYNENSSPEIKNSIFWSNVASIEGNEIYNTVGANPPISYCVVQGGYSGGTNIVDVDPVLGALADNGGATQTCAILSNSSAVYIPKSAGSNDWNGCPENDQRGYYRPLSGNRACGAYDPNAKQFKVSFIAGTNGTIDGDAVQILNNGENCTPVTPAPNDNYHFVNWTGDYTGTENPLTITNVIKDMTITSNFEHDKANLTIAVNGNGTINPVAGTYNIDTVTDFAISATPNTGHHFVNWTATAGATIADADFTDTTVSLTVDATVTANFVINAYTVTFIEGANGTITGTKVQTVNPGSDCTAVTAAPNAGYHFTDWTGDVTSSDNTLTVTNVTKNMTITANFEHDKANLTMAVTGNGTTNPSVGTSSVDTVTQINIHANPLAGNHFVNWTSTTNATVSDINSQNTTVSLIGDATVTANFAISTYTVNFIAGSNGALTGEATQTVEYGIDCSPVTAVPNAGYIFYDWTGDYTGNENPLEITNVTKDMTITANFIPENATLTMAVNPNESGLTSPSIGAHTVNTGVEIEISAIPASGYKFVDWTVEGNAALKQVNGKNADRFDAKHLSECGGSTPLSNKKIKSGIKLPQSKDGGAVRKIAAFSKRSEKKMSYSATVTLTGDATITANFEAIPATAQLTMASSPAEGGTTTPVTGISTVNTQTLLSITATANTGYNFVNWTATADATVTNANSAVTTVTLNGDAAVTANFAQTQATAELTVEASPAEGGTTSPSGTSTVNTGEEQTITATPAEGCYFVNWTASNANASIADGLSESTTVVLKGDCTLSANFAELPDETSMAYGRLYTYTGDADFAKSPKMLAIYTDPVKGGKPKKATMKVLTKIGKIPVTDIVSEWKGRITLFNKKLWDKTLTCEENLLGNPIDPLPTDLYVNNVDSGIDLNLFPPEITGVYDPNGNDAYSAKAGGKLTIKGTFFGTTPPIVWLEYPVYDKDGDVKEIKALRLKCDKVLKYKNSKGVPGKSCMEIETGLSEITISMPSAWSKNWDHEEFHNIVIDNKVGRATIEFQTED